MKVFFYSGLFMALSSWASPKVETFVVTINDRSMVVNAPETRREVFSVLIENRTQSDQVAKFMVHKTNLKFINIKSGETESVEIQNKTLQNVVFVPISPAFQEVELIFGKKVYEIPSKE